MPLNGVDISLIVPTFNRADFLARLLAYYARVQFQGHILIGDASGNEQAGLIQKTVREYQNSLKVYYHHLPGTSIAQTVFVLNGFIQTPFAVLIGDDDFLVVDGLYQCAHFLGNNPDYAAANGLGALMLVEGGKVYGRIEDLGDYPLKEVNGQTPGERLESFLKNYCVVLFSLFRVNVWRQMWTDASGVRDVAFAAELLPNCVGVIMGKVKHLDALYLIRQGHHRRYSLPDGYDWITSESWQQGYQFFRMRLMAVLTTQGLSKGDAAKRIKNALGACLNNVLLESSRPHYNKAGRAKQIRSFVEGIPMIGLSLAKLLREVNILRLSCRRKVSLVKLLFPFNRHHIHFKPIYQLITDHH